MHTREPLFSSGILKRMLSPKITRNARPKCSRDNDDVQRDPAPADRNHRKNGFCRLEAVKKTTNIFRSFIGITNNNNTHTTHYAHTQCTRTPRRRWKSALNAHRRACRHNVLRVCAYTYFITYTLRTRIIMITLRTAHLSRRGVERVWYFNETNVTRRAQYVKSA